MDTKALFASVASVIQMHLESEEEERERRAFRIRILDEGGKYEPFFDAYDEESWLRNEFDTVDEALRCLLSEFKEYATTCEDDCGKLPDCLLHQVQFVLGNHTVEKVITFRRPHLGESQYPVASILTPATGNLEVVTAEECPDDG